MKLSLIQRSLSVAVLGLVITSPVTSQAADKDKAAPAAAANKFDTAVLNRAQLDALLAHPEQVLVIDVRRPDEIQNIGSLPVYLSVQLTDLEQSLAWIPKDRKIVTVSNHAARAGKAGDLLAAKGFKVAGAVGVQNYEAEGGKLSKIAPKAPASPEKTAGVSPQ